MEQTSSTTTTTTTTTMMMMTTMSQETFHLQYQLVQMEVIFGDFWFSCEQILSIFPFFFHGHFEIARFFFGRIVDLQNFHLIFDSLTRENQFLFAKAIGYLNFLNPMYVDRLYELDLSIRDERETTKMLVDLAIVEPGENWINQKFALVGEEWIPGWQLPTRWANNKKEINSIEEIQKKTNQKQKMSAIISTTTTGSNSSNNTGVDKSGHLIVTYTSKEENGCQAVVSFRKTLFNRVLCGTRLY
jgi:hypothetical protein